MALLLAAGLGVIAGGSLAVGAAGLTGALSGLLGLLVVAPLIADPLPSPLAIAVRIVGGLLTVELLWLALHRAPDLRAPLSLGAPAMLLAGLGGAIAGLGLPVAATAGGDGTAGGAIGALPVLGTLLGDMDVSVAAVAAGVGLVVVALPAVLGRGPLGSIAIGAAVLFSGADLLAIGFIGPRTPLDHLLIAVTQVALAAAALAVASTAPVGPPLAGRSSPQDGASPGPSPDDAPLAGRRRIPVWPGARAASPWIRRRGPRDAP